MKGVRVAFGLSLVLHLVVLMVLGRSKDVPELRPPGPIIEVDVAGVAYTAAGGTGSKVGDITYSPAEVRDSTIAHIPILSSPQPRSQPQPVSAPSSPVLSSPHETIIPTVVAPVAGAPAAVPSPGGAAVSPSQQTPSGGAVSVPDGTNAVGAGASAEIYRGEMGGKNGPQFVSRRQPDYPAVARRRGLEGTVLLELHLDEQGDLRSVRVIRSDHEAFTRSAEAAVRGSRFSAARRNGRPVAAVVTLPIRFILGN